MDSQITVTALIDPSQVYVTEENFSAHKNDKNNPHEVDPYQIGAETPAGAQEKADAAKAAAIAASDPKGAPPLFHPASPEEPSRPLKLPPLIPPPS